MTIRTYLEKRSSIRKKYIDSVGKIADKIGGKGVDNIRQIPATAFESFLTPVTTMKQVPKYYKGMSEDLRILKDNKKRMLDVLNNLPSGSEIEDVAKKAFYANKRKEIQGILSEMNKMEHEFHKSRIYTTIGLGTGYGALGYGGYKGGQTVKNYIQNKKR